jgi:hypothetical protein
VWFAVSTYSSAGGQYIIGPEDIREVVDFHSKLLKHTVYSEKSYFCEFMYGADLNHALNNRPLNGDGESINIITYCNTNF